MANNTYNRRKNESDLLGRGQKTALEQLRERRDLSQDNLDFLAEYEKKMNTEVVKSKEQLLKELQDKLHKKEIEDLKAQGRELEAWFKDTGAVGKSVKALTGSLTSAIDESLNKYISAQQSMAAHLQGTNTSLTSVLNNLQSTLSTSTVVRQERVFDNLKKLVDSGIVYNVEQRAFLQTLAQDINSVFDAQNGSLTRLIRIQSQDLSANRLAIEYSLQKFLNQNYQTSEYIREAFRGVSESLFSAQVALQNSTKAIELESAVQTQLGAMYSGGMGESTIKGLADAINALGTGDISNLGSGGISNLLIMAAARAGMDYGQLLNQGVTGQQATTLLNSVVGYLSEMNDSQSNVVKSQMGKLFGVDITDIIAAGNVGQVTGSVGSNINDLFGEYSNFITFGTGLKNLMANLQWSFGTNIATDNGRLIGYEVTNMIAKSGLGDLLFQLGDAAKGNGGPGLLGALAGGLSSAAGTALQIAGIATNAAPLIPILLSMPDVIGDVFSSMTAGFGGVSSLFESLGRGAGAESPIIRMSDAGVSGGIYIGSGSSRDLLLGSTSSLNELSSLTSEVTQVTGDEITWEDNVETLTSDVASILEILDTYIQSMDDRLQTIAINTAASSVSGVAYTYATGGRSLI